jgi:hypothetical protein
MPSSGSGAEQQIRQMLSSPNIAVQRQGRALAQQLMQKRMELDKPTDEQREYAQAQRQGYQGSFFQYKTDLAKAKAQNITIDQKAEGSFDTKAGQLQADRYNDMVKSGADAKNMVSDLTALKDLGSRITTGKTAEFQAAIGPYAEALGIKIDGLDDMQTYKAIISKLAPQMRVPGSGATSDFEMRTFLEALPGLGKTPGGNELISTTLEAIAQHKVTASEIASKALNKEITRSDAEKQLRELPDPLTLWKKNKGTLSKPLGADAAPVKVASPDEARKLPKGTKIILPDGSPGVVP